jgi:hypothetical protein
MNRGHGPARTTEKGKEPQRRRDRGARREKILLFSALSASLRSLFSVFRLDVARVFS